MVFWDQYLGQFLGSTTVSAKNICYTNLQCFTDKRYTSHQGNRMMMTWAEMHDCVLRASVFWNLNNVSRPVIYQGHLYLEKLYFSAILWREQCHLYTLTCIVLHIDTGENNHNKRHSSLVVTNPERYSQTDRVSGEMSACSRWSTCSWWCRATSRVQLHRWPQWWPMMMMCLMM